MECVLDNNVCSINWLVNDELIVDENQMFTINNTVTEFDEEVNGFHTVTSRLSWNLEEFPDSRLSHNEPNITVTCKVSEFADDESWDIESTGEVLVECKFSAI